MNLFLPHDNMLVKGDDLAGAKNLQTSEEKDEYQ